MQYFIDKFIELDKNQEKVSPDYTLDELKQRLFIGSNESINLEYCEYILKRNCAPSLQSPGKYYLTRDLRLKPGFQFQNWRENILDEAEQITFPLCTFIPSFGSPFFTDSELFEDFINCLRKKSRDFKIHFIESTHHMHLNNPELVCDKVDQFIKANDLENRMVSGFEKLKN